MGDRTVLDLESARMIRRAKESPRLRARVGRFTALHRALEETGDAAMSERVFEAGRAAKPAGVLAVLEAAEDAFAAELWEGGNAPDEQDEDDGPAWVWLDERLMAACSYFDDEDGRAAALMLATKRCDARGERGLWYVLFALEELVAEADLATSASGSSGGA